VVAVALLASAGCATEREGTLADPPPRPEAEAAAAVELLWSVEDVQFVSSLQTGWVAGQQVVVTMGIDGGELVLVAYSESGEELWRHPTTGSGLARWVALEPVVDGDRAYHVAGGPGGDHVEAVDIPSGDVVWSSEPAPNGFADQLRYCNRSQNFVCITADGDGPWQVDIDTGQVGAVTDPLGAELTGVRRLLLHVGDGSYMNTDLYELDDGDVALVAGGQTYWERSPSDLFGGAAVAPDVGWHLVVSEDVVVADLGPAADTPPGAIALPADQVAGIDLATGDTLWIEPGLLHCGALSGLLGDSFGVPWTRCVTAGAVRLGARRSATTAIGTSAIEGFDPATGTTSWRVDTGAASDLWTAEEEVVRVDATTLALRRDDDSLLVVDVRDGSTPEVADDARGWCISSNEYDDGETTRVGAPLVNPCDLEGEPQEVPQAADAAMGVDLGGVFVWMDQTGLHGAR